MDQSIKKDSQFKKYNTQSSRKSIQRKQRYKDTEIDTFIYKISKCSKNVIQFQIIRKITFIYSFES